MDALTCILQMSADHLTSIRGDAIRGDDDRWYVAINKTLQQFVNGFEPEMDVADFLSRLLDGPHSSEVTAFLGNLSGFVPKSIMFWVNEAWTPVDEPPERAVKLTPPPVVLSGSVAIFDVNQHIRSALAPSTRKAHCALYRTIVRLEPFWRMRFESVREILEADRDDHEAIMDGLNLLMRHTTPARGLDSAQIESHVVSCIKAGLFDVLEELSFLFYTQEESMIGQSFVYPSWFLVMLTP